MTEPIGAAASIENISNSFSTEDLLKLCVSEVAPKILRTAHTALRKYVVLFGNNDARQLYGRFREVRDRFVTVLAGHSVRNYVTALNDLAHVPAATSALFDGQMDKLHEIEDVVRDCNEMVTKVSRAKRGPRGGGGTASGTSDGGGGGHDDAAATSGGAGGTAANEEVIRLTTENAALLAQIDGLRDRIEDYKSFIGNLLTTMRSQGGSVA